MWIQAIKVGQDWKFHDGSPLTGAFPFGMSNGSTEIHLRSRSFEGADAPEASKYHYMCEYYRQFILWSTSPQYIYSTRISFQVIMFMLLH